MAILGDGNNLTPMTDDERRTVADNVRRLTAELTALAESSQRMTSGFTALGENWAPAGGAGGNGGSHVHSHAVSHQVMEPVLQGAFLQEQNSALLMQVSNLQAQLLNEKQKLPSADPTTFRCCAINYADEDTLLCHFILAHGGGVENARRILATYPQQNDPYPVMHRERRQL